MNLLIVEDDRELAASLARELGDFGHHVTVAGDGRDALRAATEDQFDVIVLDRMLPESDGLSVLQRLRQCDVATPVILLTALGRLAEKLEGLESGADDYLVKPVMVAELNARLAVVQRRRPLASEDQDTLRAADLVVSPTKYRAWRAGKPIDLSKLELEVLAELVRNAGNVVTRQMLIEQVWGFDFQPTTNIVDATMLRLRARLTAHGGKDPIQTVRGLGYKLRA